MSNRTVVVYPVTFRDEEATRVAAMFHDVWVAMSKPRQGVMNEIFLAGLEQVMLTEDFQSKVDLQALAIHQEERRIRHELSTRAALVTVYENLTADEFDTFCADHNIDADDFRVKYTQVSLIDKAWSARAREWLTSLLSDGQYWKISEVHDRAVEAGIVTTDKQWAHLRSIASTLGFSSNEHRGTWRMNM